VDNLALVQQKTPATIAYRPWSELLTGPLVALVPRAVWPNKPTISTGNEFARIYYELPTTIYSSNAVTIPGDLYRHGGLVPLGVGMSVLGLLLGFFDRALTPSTDPRQLVIYVPLFLYLIKFERDVTVYLVALAQLLLVSLVVAWLVFAPTARAVGPGAFARSRSRIEGSCS
jgi:hypothetical protein